MDVSEVFCLSRFKLIALNINFFSNGTLLSKRTIKQPFIFAFCSRMLKMLLYISSFFANLQNIQKEQSEFNDNKSYGIFLVCQNNNRYKNILFYCFYKLVHISGFFIVIDGR